MEPGGNIIEAQHFNFTIKEIKKSVLKTFSTKSLDFDGSIPDV